MMQSPGGSTIWPTRNTSCSTRESEGTATDSDRVRLAAVKEQLDQSWDLLRQRRARRSAGLDPDDATTRPIDMVEHYDDVPPARPG